VGAAAGPPGDAGQESSVVTGVPLAEFAQQWQTMLMQQQQQQMAWWWQSCMMHSMQQAAAGWPPPFMGGPPPPVSTRVSRVWRCLP
jgi:hypothetical protein